MMDERITVKSRWHRPGDPSIARVMAVGDGWVMYRFKSAGPRSLYWRDFVKQFVPAAGRG